MLIKKFRAVGKVSNSISKREDMPMEGTPSKIMIHPRYRKALYRIRGTSHIWALCYLHRADPATLQAVPRKISSFLGKKGVFAMRSPDRPNPISLSCAKLLSARGNVLTLDSLDVIDGTPVLDIKPYSAGIDCVPSAAQPDFTGKYRLVSDPFLANTLARIVKNTCGRLNRDGAAAARLTFKYIRKSGKAPGPDCKLATNLKGDGLDALYALFNLKPSQNCIKISGKPGDFFIRVKRKNRSFTLRYDRES